MTSRRLTTALVLATVALTATPSFAHGRSRGHHRSSGRVFVAQSRVVVGRAVPRSTFGHRTVIAPRFVRARIVRVVPYRPYYYSYRPYYYRYRPGFSVASSYGYGPYYGYPYYGYAPYGYVAPPPAYLSVVPGRAYGGVRIEGAPRDAEVFVDGYYMGIVDDFDGALQHMNLEAGLHRIEIRGPGFEPIAFDVRVEPGQTITYHAYVRPE